MSEMTFAVCPSCGSPLLEQRYTDEDVWWTEIAYTGGELETPRLYHADWLKGDCQEWVTGCAACGARFSLEDAAASSEVDETEAYEQLARLAEGIDKDAFFARAPSHLASCDCGNDVFAVELTRDRIFAILYCPHADEDDPLGREPIAEPSFEIESIYCQDCDTYLDPEDLAITQIAPVIHPDQLQLAF